MDDWEHRLRTYAAALRTAEATVVADNPEDIPVSPQAGLWSLVAQLRLEHGANRVSDDDYDWYRRRALLAISEFSALSPEELATRAAAEASAAAPATEPVLPSIQTLESASDSDHSSSSGAPVVVPRPRPRIVLSEDDPPASGSGERAKRARASPLPSSTRDVVCTPLSSLFGRSNVVLASVLNAALAIPHVVLVLLRILAPIVPGAS